MSEAIHQDLSLVGGYTLDNLEIKTHSGNSIFLPGRFDEINIYESMLSPVIFGDILVTDVYYFVSYGPILGGEELLFDCSNIPSDGQPTTKRNSTFVIYTVEEKVFTDDKKGSYLIRFCSKEAIYSQQIRICSTIYKKKPTEIARSILSAFYVERDRLLTKADKSGTDMDPRRYVNETEKLYRLGKGKDEEPISVHFPNLHPLECLYYLAGRAYLKAGSEYDHGNPFFFFEQLDNKHVFMSWSELLETFNYSKSLPEFGIREDLTMELAKEGDTKRNKHVFMSLPSIWGSENKDTPGDPPWFRTHENFATVERHKFQKDFDFFENVKRGMYASTLVSYDNCSKKIVQHSWSNKHLYDKVRRVYPGKEFALNVFNDQDEPVSPEATTPGKRKSEYFSQIKYDAYVKATPTHDKLLTGGNDFCPELTKNQYVMKLQELNNNTLYVNIPGNLNFTVGTFTDVFMHSHEVTAEGKIQRDPHFAGTYVNLRVRHTFKSNGIFITAVEMAKDAFIDKTLQTFPKPTKEGT